MLNIFRKKQERRSGYAYNNLDTDMHSHILPGIDDGSPDVETSLSLIKAMEAVGITKFICTPHVIGDLYRNTPGTINTALEKLREACRKEGLGTELSAAAEYMLDDYFMELLRKKAPLMILRKNYILTELSYATPPNNLEQIAFELTVNGYQPVMAHPERYFYYHKNYDAYYRMKELGFLLQVNLLSLTGYYGKAVAKAGHFIISNGLADYVGTDLHHANHLRALTDASNLDLFQRTLGEKVYNTFS